MDIPAIDPVKTGANIKAMTKSRNISAATLAGYFGFSSPSVVFKWFRGDTMPSLDNMYALTVILDADLRDIISCI